MTTQEFIKKMAEDETLANKMSECKSPEEAYETAKEAGLTDDIEKFKTIMTAVNKQVKGELSDDELESVAGGADAEDIAGYIYIGFSAAALVTASAMASATM
ncbi:MAG: Nif11-like leader peptide family RiPP precursor [Oscillospiraceae bacterium]